MESATASIPTDHGSRYLQQLCKHWSHNLKVSFDTRRGTIIFPRNARGADWAGKARLTLVAQEDALDCRIEAGAAEQIEALKDVLVVHLERFAWREAPLRFDWEASRPRLDRRRG